MSRLAQRQRRGVMLAELLIMIILLSAFLLLAGRMFVSLMKLNRESAQAHTDTVRLDAAIRVLRADVWGTREMAGEGAALSLTSPAAVQWKIEKDGTLVRTESREGKTDEKRWPTGVAGMALRVQGPAVVLSVPQGPGTVGGEVWLTSQVRLAERLAS